MKTFGNILLLNIGIYAAYMMVLYFLKGIPAAIPAIVFHSVVCIILSATGPKGETGKKVRQGWLISGLLILIIGMPVCFLAGVGTFKLN